MANKFLSPLLDFVFKHILGNPLNIDLMADFLQSVLHLPVDELATLTISDPFLNRFWKRDKLGIVDILVKTKGGKVISVEIQVRPDRQIRSRFLFYLIKRLWSQVKRGGPYSTMQQVIGLLICNYNLFPGAEDYINQFTLRNSKTGQEFTDLLKVVTVELPKLPKEPNGSEEWPWLQFFKCKTMEEMMELAQRFPRLGRMVELMKELNLSEGAQRLADAREKARWAQEAREQDRFDDGKAEGRVEGLVEGKAEGRVEGLVEGKAEGLAEGKAEGRVEGLVEGKREDAQKMKLEGFSPEQISRVTGLSREEIDS
jgi:predicted transposase/invertase (TIGR01784 family)